MLNEYIFDPLVLYLDKGNEREQICLWLVGVLRVGRLKQRVEESLPLFNPNDGHNENCV